MAFIIGYDRFMEEHVFLIQFWYPIVIQQIIIALTGCNCYINMTHAIKMAMNAAQ